MQGKVHRLFSLTAISSLALIACIPTVSKIYNGPEVKGVVLRLSDLTPIAEARISYSDANALSSRITAVKSNAEGKFILTPETVLKMELRMAGHMLERTTVHTHYITYGQSADVVVSKWQNREYETFSIGAIILDDNPSEYAMPLVRDGVDLKALRKSFQPDGLLDQCNQEDATGAINKLNIFRKLARSNNAITGQQDDIITEYIHDIKTGTENIWAFFIAECNDGKPSEDQKRIKRQVLQELDSL